MSTEYKQPSQAVDDAVPPPPQQSASMFPHALNESDIAATPTPPVNPSPKAIIVPKRAIFAIAATVVLAVLTLGGYTLYAMKLAADAAKMAESSNTTTVQPVTDTAPSATPAVQQPAVSLPFKLFVPDGSHQNPSLLVTKDRQHGLFTYSRNVSFGQGITKGSFGFSVYKQDGSRFNPPADCGVPRVKPSASDASHPCVRYPGSTTITAYTTDRQATPGGIQNTSVEKYITMYAAKDGSVIVIESADTPPETLYDILLGMTEYPVSKLPPSAISEL